MSNYIRATEENFGEDTEVKRSEQIRDNVMMKDKIEEILKAELLLDEENLKVTHYQNGDPIPLAVSDEQWKEFGKMRIGAYSIADNGEYYYNWYAVDDERGLAPKGWRIPNDKEWDKLKEQLLEFPTYGGYRYNYGSYGSMGSIGYFWSSSEYDSNNGWYRKLYYYGSDVYRTNYNKQNGFSVRCVKVGK